MGYDNRFTPAQAENWPGGLISLIEGAIEKMPPKASQIGRAILDSPEDVIHASITEFASRAQVAEGSIISFCRRLGLSGFQALKLRLAREIVAPIQLIQEDLAPRDTPRDIAGKLFAAHMHSLRDTLELLDDGRLARAVKVMRAARWIEVYGIGSSAPVAQDMAYRLLQIGISAQAAVDSHVQAVSASKTGPHVTTVTISHSGSTHETVLATRLAKEAGATTIGITRFSRTPLEKYCDIVFHTAARETRYRPEAMSSRVSQLALVDTLVSCLAAQQADLSIEALQDTAQVLAHKRY
jgi:RpiR family carbohydrate utilization transcriptional regulator